MSKLVMCTDIFSCFSTRMMWREGGKGELYLVRRISPSSNPRLHSSMSPKISKPPASAARRPNPSAMQITVSPSVEEHGHSLQAIGRLFDKISGSIHQDRMMVVSISGSMGNSSSLLTM